MATFYDGTIPVLQSLLRTLSHILQKASSHADPTKTEETLFAARLIPDMFALPDQIRLATQFAENLAARLTARDPTTFADKPTTFAASFERIETVLAALAAADKEVVNAQADVLTETTLGPATVQMSGSAYAHTVVLPNVYFHVVTAYGILRKEGVDIGKRDYYQGFFPKTE